MFSNISGNLRTSAGIFAFPLERLTAQKIPAGKPAGIEWEACSLGTDDRFALAAAGHNFFLRHSSVFEFLFPGSAKYVRFEVHDFLIHHRVADLDRLATDFAIFNVHLAPDGRVQHH
jgi:hypothetical protein